MWLRRVLKTSLRHGIAPRIHRGTHPPRTVQLIESNRTLISKIQTSFNIPQIMGQTAFAIGLYTLATTTIYIGSISDELSDFYAMWTRSLDEEFEKARVEWMLRSILTEDIDPTGVIDDCVTTTNAKGVICTGWDDEVD
ncbi:hypothetical protein TWF970_007324 [Orbilia oligospora]|uniref:Uncharacterized protein n=1 Tax=Orbilia oligospora TaxID=2813651 RepID=A0A7C8VX22_ORBOL|nr:hypothetical protein TWF970_007324 [Orbilia oligospora]